jgi:hypothetical protein
MDRQKTRFGMSVTKNLLSISVVEPDRRIALAELEPECITVPDPNPEPDLDPGVTKNVIKKVKKSKLRGPLSEK